MLREECGYKGHLPYWNWAHYAHDPTSGPLLDGSDTSLSGDGSYLPGRNYSCIGSTTEGCQVRLYPGSGGGCVTSGPFKDWTINMGPRGSLMNEYLKPNPQADGMGYNPRCLRRDINRVAANATNDFEVSSLIKGNKDIANFQDDCQGRFEQGLMGVHAAGHYQIGGDAGSDIYNSPADPTFFLHHGMIDRVWWTWQNFDIESRQYAIAGQTLLGGGGRNGTLDDIISLGDYVGAPNITVREAMNTLDGPFCYIYA
ncbi:tyrosinase central domain protein [Pyrenophora tritici-repentis]|uniref:Tyrosinase central domain protein n=2 Tax=Pyrenophora tritici-repentis TaxID=45151 RepID=A0A2W1FJ80_9PLEO|nr:tyrosinase central domain protein [Pyrenophora tritici-repentis]KAF7564318.1 tyrosinase central domain protein [Pyrenophora tritici-repentis]KAF7567878.1 tyrosinase central domain protein [Pyrenophora tritici-repentis]KAI0569627.1 tyrosinase central domain protein [Pyrenophora tritici-repentis]KAI1684293.1 Common central domain of tyrosinase [Pyrenophora tritici-repentis]